jgi:hypothetical protein
MARWSAANSSAAASPMSVRTALTISTNSSNIAFVPAATPSNNGRVSFLVFGWPSARRSPEPGKTTAALLAITWVTGSWWLHDNLHMHVGMNLPGLMAIEYGFHFTVGLAGLVLGYLFIDAVKSRFQLWTPDSPPYETDPDKLASRPSHQ